MELRICVPTKLPDDADTASPQTTLSIKGLADIDPSPPPTFLPPPLAQIYCSYKTLSTRFLLKPRSGQKHAILTDILPGWPTGLTHPGLR